MVWRVAGTATDTSRLANSILDPHDPSLGCEFDTNKGDSNTETLSFDKPMLWVVAAIGVAEVAMVDFKMRTDAEDLKDLEIHNSETMVMAFEALRIAGESKFTLAVTFSNVKESGKGFTR